MKTTQLKTGLLQSTLLNTTLKNYWPLYTLTIVITYVMRHLNRVTDSDKLLWILKPTAGWVSVLSGISFEYLPHMGYVNHFYQFLIASSCAGIRFMLLTFLMLTFSFLYQIKTPKAGYLWFGFSLVFSYVSTILVNGVRITVSIYLPVFLGKRGLMNGALTSDRLHTLIGTSTYFLFLCLIYLFAQNLCKRMKTAASPQNDTSVSFFRLVIPTFWYLLLVLALPFIKRIYQNEWEGFGQYAALILGVCLTIVTLLHLIRIIHRGKAS